MKRKSIWMLIGVYMLFSLCGCGKGKADENGLDFSKVNKLTVSVGGNDESYTSDAKIIKKMFPKDCKYEKVEEPVGEKVAGAWFFHAYHDEEELYMIIVNDPSYVGIVAVSEDVGGEGIYKVENIPDYDVIADEIQSGNKKK